MFLRFLRDYPNAPKIGEVSVILGWIFVEIGELSKAKTYFEDGLSDKSVRVRDSANAGLKALEKSRV